MADIVTGVLGGALFITFLAFILVRVGDPALWLVSIVGIGAMILAVWGDTMVPYLRRGRRTSDS